MRTLILSIDQGTTNTKALLVDTDGRPIFRATAALTLQRPQPGFAEQDPLAIWQSVLSVIAECVAFAAAESALIAGITLSNQRETALAWDRATGHPVAPAMSWQCRRAASLCHALSEHAQLFRERSGLPLDPLVSASKWAWLLRDDPALQRRATAGELCFGTVDSWLLYKLTQSLHACDTSNASRTGLMNLQSLQWDRDLLALFDIPLAALPSIQPSCSIFGLCTNVPGLDRVPIVAALGDSHAAMLGHGSAAPGTVKATYGTGSSLMLLTPHLPPPDPRLAATIAWTFADTVQCALEGNISMTGSAVQWVGEFLQLPNPLHDTLALAATVPGAAGVCFVPAMVGLAAPHWDTAARGTLTGLESTSTAAHMARAALDAIAFQVRDVFDAMQQAARLTLPALHADGGATHNATLMQLQANTLGRTVLRSACEDLSALGVAWLGGITLGWWSAVDQLAALPEPVTRFEPQLSAAECEQHYRVWQRAVRCTLACKEAE